MNQTIFIRNFSFLFVTATGGRSQRMGPVCGHHVLMMNSAGKPGAGRIIFNLDHLRSSFRFQLPEASILTLEDPAQLITLPKLHPWEPKKPLELAEGELPTMEQLKEWFVPNWCYLDFEKLEEEYDAIELRNSGASLVNRCGLIPTQES